MFKKGDKVRRLRGLHMGMSTGDIATIEGFSSIGTDLKLVEYTGGHDPLNFELVEDNKETTSKWLKKNAWYIRVESPEHSKLIQEWLFEHGMQWEFSGSEVSYTDSPILTNLRFGGKTEDCLLHSTANRYCIENAQELLPQFKLTLEGITLPESPKKTEQQIKLEELEATIQKAQAEIQQLKEMK